MPQLSIIVPIYNVEKYLSKCIESILVQSYTDFELILINDGSPDNCAEIMEKYAQEDNRIIAIYQKNKGVSAARNAGLKMASGKYVGFVDPDDYIENNFFQELISAIEETKTEIACCNYDSFFEDGKKIVHKITSVPPIMTQKMFLNCLFDSPRTIMGSNCNKLFLREKISQYYDESLAICEDNLFLFQYCQNINGGCYVDKTLYHIFEREDSATRKNLGKLVLGLEVRKKIIELARNLYKETGSLAEKDFLDTCYLYYIQLDKESEKQYRLVAWNEFQDYMKKNFFRVMTNNKIFWKTRLVYLWRIIR